MGSDHIQLLLHTEVRWLSRGRMLSRLFELHSEVQLFLGETNFELKDKLTDNLWITTLAYLSDIFNRLNVLNLSLQGKSINRFSMNDKIKAFIMIIEMSSNNVSNENLQSFPNWEQFMTEHKFQVEADLIKNIKYRCKMLKTMFKEYFKEDYSEFFLDLDDIPKTLTNNEKKSLIELSCDES